MKVVFFIASWCTLVFMMLLALYHCIPVEVQYSMAEHFGVYGDESVMDFLLYVFFGLSILLASIILSCFLILIRKK